MPDTSSAARPPKGKGKPGEAGKGKKVLGMDRRVAVVGGVALLGGVLFIMWRNRQANAAGGSQADTGAGTSAVPDTSGMQGGGMQGATGTETLVIKIRQMQGHKPKPKRKPPHEPPPPRHKRPKGHRMRPPHIVKGPVPPTRQPR